MEADMLEEPDFMRHTLITTYIVTVDGKIVYQGDSWGISFSIFQLHAWNVNHKEVTHKVERKLVERRGYL
jgi:hypothetical protein